MLEIYGRRQNLWWCGKGDGVYGAGVMVKGELFENVVEVSDVVVVGVTAGA